MRDAVDDLIEMLASARTEAELDEIEEVAVSAIGRLDDQAVRALVARSDAHPAVCAAVVEACASSGRRILDFVPPEVVVEAWCRAWSAAPQSGAPELIEHAWPGATVMGAPMPDGDRLLLVRLIDERCGDEEGVAWLLGDGPVSELQGTTAGRALVQATAAREPWLQRILAAGEEP